MINLTKFEQKILFKECRQLIKQENQADTQLLLSRALRQNKFDSAGVLQAGRMLGRLTTEKNINISLFGQFTTSWLVHALQASAMARGEMLNIDDEPYDNVMQGLMTLGSHIDVVILLPWHQRLFAPDANLAGHRVEEELEFWRQAWQLIKQNSNARIVQVGYDWIDGGASGQFIAAMNDGEVNLIRSLNQQIRENLPDSGYFVDLEQISGILGRQQFYAARGYLWTKQPFSETGLILLSRYLWAGIRATVFGPNKVLVLDLDNTLWGGIVGEVGAHGIELGDNPAGEAFRNFQQLVKQIGNNGCLLAACSKNNDKDAREPFELNTDLV